MGAFDSLKNKTRMNEFSLLFFQQHAFNSSLKEAIDLEDALKMADKLNRSSHRMLSTLRADVSNSDFL